MVPPFPMMTLFSRLLLVAFAVLTAVPLRAAPKATPIFNEQFHVFGNVLATAVLPNGQVLIGGDFSTVNGVEQRHVARLNADGTLDSAWRPRLANPVRRLAVAGDEVYLMGQPSFTDQVGGKGDPTIRRTTLSGDGQIDPAWGITSRKLPRREFDDFLDLAVSDGFVYLLYQRNDFTARGLPDRLVLGRYFRSGTGALDSSWTPKILASRSPFLIMNLARVLVDAGHVYVAHERSNAGATMLERYAFNGRGAKDQRWSQAIRLEKSSGLTVGGVADAEQDADFVYLAGFGLKLRPTSVALGRIAKSTGRADSTWPDAAIATSLAPQSLAVSSSTAYFTSPGIDKPLLVAYPTAPGGLSFTKTLDLSLTPRVEATGDTLFLQTDALEPLRLNRLLRFDASTAAIDARFETRIFRPAVINQVLRTDSGLTYVAGRFDAVGDLAIRGLVRFSADGKLDTAWTPNPGPLDKLFLTGDLAYGFAFGSVSRFSLAAPGLRDASWNPGEKLVPAGGFVSTAEFTAEGVFVEYRLPNSGGVDGARLRRIPLDGDGTPDPAWNATLSTSGTVLKAHAGFLYLGSLGSFSPVERFALNGGGVRDPGWRIDVGGGASIAGDENFVYLTDGAGQPRRYAIAGTGLPDPAWRPGFAVAQIAPDGTEQTATIASLQKTGPWLYAGGFFDTVGGAAHLSVARIGADGAVDPDFSSAVPFVVSIDDFQATQSGPRWVGAFGDTPVLGGIFEEIDGVPARVPAIFNALTPPTLTRSGARVFASLAEGADLGIDFFRVTALMRGFLATSGGRPLALGSFVSVEEAAAGLDFTPDPNTNGARSLSLASATAAEVIATGSESATIELTDTLPTRNRYAMAVAALTVREGAASALIAVQKIGAAAGGVTFVVEEGVARAGQHFTTPAVLTLDFPPGDGSAVIAVPLLDDLVFTGDKDFRVMLTGTTDGGLLLTPMATNVSLQDDDPLGDAGSLLVRPALPAAPASTASLRVALNAPLGAWRLLGETTWHASGTLVSGLTSGNYFVEFRQVNGFVAPPARTVPVTLGEAVSISADYISLNVAAIGALAVSIEPASVAGADGDARGQWRIIGETAWRDSGTVAEGLPAGPYEMEFKPVVSRATPPPQTVNVAGAILYTITGTYLVEDATPGETPAPLSFAATQAVPYGFAGQVHSSAGFASGTAVRSRVVLTVAHALFDDVTLSAVTDARWYHQKARGDFEPPPQVARGWYIFDGYASQRATDLGSGSGSVGISTPESQRFDVAAMWFLTPSARGSFSGFLRTDPDNEWLLAARRRTLAGYPLEGVPEPVRGVLHASNPDTAVPMTKVNDVVYSTAAVKGFPGMSGGPLFVEKDGAFFPAAIFLGGTAQTLVRVIDTQVVDLINRGEVSGNGGDNNVGGGITVVSPGVTASPFAPTLIGCTFGPAGAVANGGGWRIAGEETFRASGARLTRNPGTYRIEFKTVPGFAVPPSQVVNLVEGQIATARANYRPGVRINSVVSPAGAGTAPSDEYPLGDSVTLQARPGPDFLFSTWSENGQIISRNAALTFAVNGPRNLIATFIEGSFVAYAGAYSGLHETGGIADGLASFTLTGTGAFSATVSYGGVTYKVKGTFDENGVFSGAAGKFPLLIGIDRTTPTGVITGQIFDGGMPSRFSATQSPFNAARPTALAGTYTLLLPPANASDDTRPQGHGFATLNVTASGELRFAGKLADGVSFAGASTVREDGLWEFYVPTFKGTGLVVGTLTFQNQPNVSDAHGQLRWVRPAAQRDGLFPAGFATTLPVVASRYSSPPIDYADAVLNLSSAPLSSPLSFSEKFVATSLSDPSIRIALKAATGVFLGSAKSPVTKKRLLLEGVVFQKSRSARGYFRNTPPNVGAVEIEPRP